MEQLIQGLMDKIKILETREDQDRQENAAMHKEIKHLQGKVSSMQATESKEKPTPMVYVKSERKFPKFGGYPEKDTDPDVIDWISEMREHIRGTASKDGHADFIMDHLTGNAKAEVRLHQIEQRKTGEEILNILEHVFVIKDTVTQLLQKFYQRDQIESETLENYSRILMQMQERINKKVDKKMQITDINLTERFIDGIRDRVVRQELRKIVVEQSTIPFQEFRLRMLKWVDDNPPCENKQLNAASAIVSISDPLTDLLTKQQAMLEKQQHQIDTLTQTLQKFQQSDSPRRGNRPGPFRGRGRGIGKQDQFVCYACNGHGHFSSECANRKKELSQNKVNRQLQQQPRTKFQKTDPKVKPSQWRVAC
ncbi:uncharacterized protein LOC134271164 [Saccostrea cucullata]|uniref:uncharacterized protein LOC134271164 n=1 Tax=Saccostrea cuccullata TaxID=36930 RepID=UPI002ED45DA4